jgi:hypothetical protein
LYPILILHGCRRGWMSPAISAHWKCGRLGRIVDSSLIFPSSTCRTCSFSQHLSSRLSTVIAHYMLAYHLRLLVAVASLQIWRFGQVGPRGNGTRPPCADPIHPLHFTSMNILSRIQTFFGGCDCSLQAIVAPPLVPLPATCVATPATPHGLMNYI